MASSECAPASEILRLLCRDKVEEYEANVRNQTQEEYKLQKELGKLRNEMRQLQAQQQHAVSSDFTSDTRAKQRYQELQQLKIMEEDRLNAEVADLTAQLDAEKAESFKLAWEVKATGEHAQRTDREARFTCVLSVHCNCCFAINSAHW